MDTTIINLGTILSVWAHPDDETYLAGGLMAAAVDSGQRVVCVTATAGERGTGDPETWPPSRLGRVRSLEATAAMAVLGVTEHHVLGLPDGELAEHADEGTALVGQLLDQVRPDTVVTFGPDGITFHPDHIAVHRWVRDACEQRGWPARLLHATWTAEHLARFGHLHEELGIYMSDARPAGVPAGQLSVHLRLDESALDRKLVALRAMATQTAPLFDAIGADLYAAQVTEESFVDAPTSTTNDTARTALADRVAVSSYI
ncbi:MAG TPA: PIG-L family deacetylase [Ilumatobacter sp.]|nr:PIG-L family deacetylase [Ilumatobacter sp.]